MRSDDLYLVDLIEAADDIERLLRGRDFSRFAQDERRSRCAGPIDD